MADPVADLYAAPGGATLRAGCFPTGAVVEVSLTELVSAGDATGGTVVSAPPEAPTTGGITITQMRAGSAGLQPIAFGQPFAQGDLPSGASLSGAQLNVLTTWPDGSAKTTIVSGYATISAGVDRPVALASGTAPTGATITTAALAAVTAQHDCGTFGAVAWGASDWATPHLTVCTGPLMSSWVFRKGLVGEAHLVAWLEVRAWRDGQVQVLPWVENGYINVGGPTNKSATYAFTLAGTVRCAGVAIDIRHHQRTPLINGPALWYWVGADPGIVPIHDAAYLERTELVPPYSAVPAAGNARVAAQPTSFSPLQIGSLTYDSDAMTSPGYQEPIGLIPEHDVLHQVAADADRATTFRSVVRNGYSAGRYGIHYRDEATNRPLKFSNHPTRVAEQTNSSFASSALGSSSTNTFCATPLSASAPKWDPAHAPSVGFMAHLLTGLYYFAEEVQFAATAEFLCKTNSSIMRNGADNLVQSVVGGWQTRAAAWQWRTLVQALCVTPDADTNLRADLLASVHANIDNMHATYVAQANNPFGFVQPGESAYDGTTGRIAIWQQDFVTAAWGYAKALGLPVDSTRRARMDAFFAWKAKSVVGRMDVPSTFPFENANRYALQLPSTTVNLNYGVGGAWSSANWPTTWAEIYARTAPLAITPDNPLATPGGNVLATEFTTDAAKGNWGTLQMAIAYAVRFGVPGASEARARMLGATNYTSMLANNFSALYPVMSVKPQSDPLAFPTWRQGLALNQWHALPNTAIATLTTDVGTVGERIFSNFCGTVQNETHGEYQAFGDGHGGGSGNEVCVLNLTANTPAWAVRSQPTPTGQRVPMPSEGFTAAGQDWWGTVGSRKPNPPHTYSSGQWIASLNRFMYFGYFGPFNAAGGVDSRVLQFKRDTMTWVQPEDSQYLASSAVGRITCKAPDGAVYGSGGGQAIYKFDPTQPFGSQFSLLVNNSALNWSGYGAYVYDTSRNRILRIGAAYNSASIQYFLITLAGAVTDLSSVLNGASGVLSGLLSRVQMDSCGACYDVINDRYIVPTGSAGGSFYSINAGTWAVTLESPATSSGSVSADHGGGAGIYGRVHFNAALKCIVYMPNANGNVAILPLAN